MFASRYNCGGNTVLLRLAFGAYLIHSYLHSMKILSTINLSMSISDIKKLHPHVPFLYKMTVSFFEMAKENAEPVLQAIDGCRESEIDAYGRPKAPNHVTDKIKDLPPTEMINVVGTCLSAATNLGLAYAHALRLLNLLTQGKDVLSAEVTTLNLVKLFDALPGYTQQKLHDIYDKVKMHDLEMEIASKEFPAEHRDCGSEIDEGFRATLAYWQSQKLLQDSHFSLFGQGDRTVLRLFVPFRSIVILDKIVAEQLAPQLNATYETVDQRKVQYDKGPVLEWDADMIHIALPKRFGRTLDARWKPDITSVIRIKESGTEMWSPGFETPLNQCSFVDLKPDTEYEVKLTHKNEAGESEPVISSMRTRAE